MMLPLDIKQRICEYLAESKSFETLEILKRASKEWYYIILSLQWSEYDKVTGPKWFAFKSRFERPNSVYEKKACDEYTSAFQMALREYGHYFIKRIETTEEYNKKDQLLGMHFPKLLSLIASGDYKAKILPELLIFIEMNPAIVSINLRFGSPNIFRSFLSRDPGIPIIDSIDLIRFNSQCLKQLKIDGAVVHVPKVSYIPDNFPKLAQFETRILYVDDVSDVIVSKDSPSEMKQYPNFTQFQIENFCTPRTNPQVQGITQLNYIPIQLFPNLSDMALIKLSTPSNSVSSDTVSLALHNILEFPYSNLSKLHIESISASIASSLQTNCPDLCELSICNFSIPKDDNVHDIMKIISVSLLQLVRLNLDFGTLRDWGYGAWAHINTSIFFQKSAKAQETLPNNPNADYQQPGLLFDNALEFKCWPHLKQISLSGTDGFSPRILLWLAQFKYLEKLEFNLQYLDHISDIKYKTSAWNIKKRKGAPKDPKNAIMLPKVTDVVIHFEEHAPCYLDDCRTLVNFFPSLKNISVSGWNYHNGRTWYEVEEDYPDINWVNYFPKY